MMYRKCAIPSLVLARWEYLSVEIHQWFHCGLFSKNTHFFLVCLPLCTSLTKLLVIFTIELYQFALPHSFGESDNNSKLCEKSMCNKRKGRKCNPVFYFIQQKTKSQTFEALDVKDLQEFHNLNTNSIKEERNASYSDTMKPEHVQANEPWKQAENHQFSKCIAQRRPCKSMKRETHKPEPSPNSMAPGGLVSR